MLTYLQDWGKALTSAPHVVSSMTSLKWFRKTHMGKNSVCSRQLISREQGKAWGFFFSFFTEKKTRIFWFVTVLVLAGVIVWHIVRCTKHFKTQSKLCVFPYFTDQQISYDISNQTHRISYLYHLFKHLEVHLYKYVYCVFVVAVPSGLSSELLRAQTRLGDISLNNQVNTVSSSCAFCNGFKLNQFL